MTSVLASSHPATSLNMVLFLAFLSMTATYIESGHDLPGLRAALRMSGEGGGVQERL